MHNCSKQYLPGRSLQTIVLMLLLLISQPLFAFTFDVNDTTDAVDDNPGDGVCHTAANTCTLRAAIQEANAWLGPDVIRLDNGTYNLTIAGNNENRAASGDLDITDSVKIYGVDKSSTIINGNQLDRIFDIVSTSATVTLANMTIQGGRILDSLDTNGNPSCTASFTSEPGAGIRNSGNLTVNDSTIQGNEQRCSGGGGIANENGGVTLNYVDILGNHANAGAGINQNFGLLVINNSLISGNIAVGAGGGIHAFNGTTKITNSIFDNNSGPQGQNGLGGGIDNEGNSILTLASSTVSNNTSGLGGGINNCCGTGTVTVINSTITQNTALQGGGINTEYNISIINSTISNNKANGATDALGAFHYGGGLYYKTGTATIRDTIFSGNTRNITPYANNCEMSTPVQLSGGYNVDSDGTCQFSASGDKNNVDPLLGTLSHNGGPTQTQTLGSSSPAIDGGNPLGCTDQSNATLTTDQRSFPRPDGLACDIGAVETQSTTGLVDLSVHVTASPTPITPGGSLTYTVTVKNNGPNITTGPATLTDTLPSNVTMVSATSGCSGAGTSNVSCTISSLGVGSEAVITITASVPLNATSTLTNTAVVTGPDPDANSANNTESSNTSVNLTADFQITMTDSPDPAVLNQDQVTYTMTVTSLSGATVPNVTLVDSLPGGATLVTNSTTTTKGTCAENSGTKQVTCNLGNMSPSNTAVITLKVKPNIKGTITNTADVNFDGTDTDPTNNKASQTTAVQAVADLSISVTDDRDPVGVKNDLSYIINVKNNGPSPSSDVILHATLPSSATYSPPASASQGLPCTESSGVITCDLQGMAKDAQATVTIFVVPQSIEPIQISASVQVASDETDPDSSNNSATETTNVVDDPTKASADLSIGIAGTPNPVDAGATLTYTITVKNNNGPDTATGVIAILSLPASVTVSSPGNGCVKDSQTNIVRCSMSNLSNGASAQATVGVTPSQAGVIKATTSTSFIGTDPDISNNTATLSTTVNAAPSGGGSSSGGGGGNLDALSLLVMLSAWLIGARVNRRRGTSRGRYSLS